MIFTVELRGETIGTVEIEETPRVVIFSVDCVAESCDLLRCYGITQGEPLLIGVLEPTQEGRLHCRKQMTRQSLDATHCGSLPTRYMAVHSIEELPSARAARSLWTGDKLLDALLDMQQIEMQETTCGLRLRCDFACDKPFPLSFAASACSIERNAQKYYAYLQISPFYRTE